MHRQRFDGEILQDALCRLPNLKHVYFLMQQDDWRLHSQSSSIQRLMQGWKQSSDMYHHWGATKPTGQIPRDLSFRRSLHWLFSASEKPIALESLVISGFRCATVETDYDLTNTDPTIISGLRHLTLDFRIKNGGSLRPWDGRWFKKALTYLVSSSLRLESLDIFCPTSQHDFRLNLSEIFDWNIEQPSLHQVRLSFVTIDEDQLRLLIHHFNSSLRKLTIESPVFNQQMPWKEFVLSDSHGIRLVEDHQPSKEEMINFYARAWAAYGSTYDSGYEQAVAEVVRGDETGQMFAQVRRAWSHRRHDEAFRLEWPEGHVFEGATGTYEDTGIPVVTVEWPEDRGG